ncbi:large ribosomal subunit protein uL30m [Streptomyces sp. NPDC051445]|uniref:large ribosomal subunit protein uL30m n=1 Tax=Streptomyces sp. NPDC051445 TaxID=3365653 RepID=UPI003797A4DC
MTADSGDTRSAASSATRGSGEVQSQAKAKSLVFPVGHISLARQVRRPSTQRQLRTLASLGLKGIGQENVVDLTDPSKRGMVRAVSHLLDIIEYDDDVLDSASMLEVHLDEINSQSLNFLFGGDQYLKAMTIDADLALTWPMELSLARVFKKLTHLLPNSDGFLESAGEVWWSGGRRATGRSANKALREARRDPASVAFFRVGYNTPSRNFSFSWLSPRSGESGYAQGGFRCPRSDLQLHSRIISATATYRVARSVPELVPRILKME